MSANRAAFVLFVVWKMKVQVSTQHDPGPFFIWGPSSRTEAVECSVCTRCSVESASGQASTQRCRPPHGTPFFRPEAGSLSAGRLSRRHGADPPRQRQAFLRFPRTRCSPHKMTAKACRVAAPRARRARVCQRSRRSSAQVPHQIHLWRRVGGKDL